MVKWVKTNLQKEIYSNYQSMDHKNRTAQCIASAVHISPNFQIFCSKTEIAKTSSIYLDFVFDSNT